MKELKKDLPGVTAPAKLIPFESNGRITCYCVKRDSGEDMYYFTPREVGTLTDWFEEKKTPVFTTNDGKEMFEGEMYWYVSPDFRITWFNTENNMTYNDNAERRFSTREAAENYVLMKKNLLSVEQVVNEFYKICLDSSDFEEIKCKLLELAKQNNKA